MFHLSDFGKCSRIKPLLKADDSVFSLTLNKVRYVDHLNVEYGIVKATKPLVYFIALFGMQTVQCPKNGVLKANYIMKAYSLIIITTIIFLTVFVRPLSWRDSMDDPPLYILTKIYVILQVIEVVHSIFITSIWNNDTYVGLFIKLANIDAHYSIGHRLFGKRRVTAFFLIFLLTLQTILTSWLRKFQVDNLLTQFTFTCLMLNGILSSFILWNIYLNLLILNTIILNKISNLPFGRKFIFKDTLFNKFLKIVYIKNLQVFQKKKYCWFEIMEIYDKISDCISLFSKIYSDQILIMFTTWLLCTVLAICRTISPSIKYSEVYKSDIVRFLSICSRPVVLTKFSEYFIQERRKTLMVILHIMTYGGYDTEYFDQVQTMADLVETRKLEVSANVFTVEIPIMLSFAGTVISYSVLMIQYFYIHVFTS